MKKIATAVAVTLVGATLAFAMPHDSGHGPGRHDQAFAQELNLTDAQKAQIEAIRKDSHEKNKAFFEQSRSTMQEFFAAKQANDTAKMDALKPAVEAQRAQMKQIRAAEDAKIGALLTAEQNAKWQQLKAQHADKHQRQ